MSPPHAHLDRPSAWVARFAPLVPAGAPVLDLACGGGRHARLFAARGHPVDAVDRDADALAGLAAVEGIRTLRADLEGGPWPYPGRRYGGIVVANYLHRPLFPTLAEMLDAPGVLIYETFMLGHERHGRPSNPAFLLRPHELLDWARRDGLAVVAFEQGEVERPGRAVVQRLCATKGMAPESVHIS